MAVNSLGESSRTNLLRYGKRCDSHKGGDRGRSDLRNACRRMNHVEYSHAKDVAARVPGRPVLLVHPEKGAVQYRFAHSADRWFARGDIARLNLTVRHRRSDRAGCKDRSDNPDKRRVYRVTLLYRVTSLLSHSAPIIEILMIGDEIF